MTIYFSPHIGWYVAKHYNKDGTVSTGYGTSFANAIEHCLSSITKNY